MKSCAESNLKKASLELGGKSPFLIFADCDLDKAIRMVSPTIDLICVGKVRLFIYLNGCYVLKKKSDITMADFHYNFMDNKEISWWIST